MAHSKDPPPPAARPTTAATKAPVVVKTGATPAMKTGATPAVKTGATPAVASDGMKLESLVIVFADLSRFQIASRRVKDDALVAVLEEYYERIADGVKPAGGRVVKFMGDGALIVFPAERASQAARALLMLKSDVDARLTKRKFLTSLVVRAHAGEAMAGAIGPKTDKRYDVIGHAVNRTAAMRAGEPFALTGEAYGKLDAKTQKLFKAKGDSFVPA
jgi:class 3 adenylate cyclase